MALFGFLGGKKTTVGLDIGSGIIKLAVVDHSGSEPELTKVVTAVGGRDVIVKKIQMDRMKEQDAREVIRWEAEQHVPFDMASVELDFQILDPDAEGLQMDVLLVAVKRELVEGRVSLLSEAGLQAAVIDVDAFAIHNALELNHPDATSGVVAMVNVGHEVTNVNILDALPISRGTSRAGAKRSRWGWSGRRRSWPRHRGRRGSWRACSRAGAGPASRGSTTPSRAGSRCRWKWRARCSGCATATRRSRRWRSTKWRRC